MGSDRTLREAGDGGEDVVRRRIVGDQRGTQIAITDGLSGGETVVTSGQIKLREGAPVQIKEQPSPADTAEAEVEEP
jgi:hypothetical protein